jgi:aspartyl-tRNA(Asn)/glutamyl-tRNA(Gln) amidotransferase subunit A
MKPTFQTIQEIHDAFDHKKISATELAQGYLARAKASKHNAYLHLSEERALAQAKSADAIIAQEGKVPRDRMPLLGIPLGIKDVLTIQGVRTTCASKIIANYVPPYTATCVERLERSGAISLGKLNMDEFAMGGSNENSAYGPVLHPTHPDRVPGGSSGGSATAVAADLAFATLGTDTGGSIRLPASFCGIVGFKPSYGRISRYGLIAFGSSLDQVGPMTHTVRDAALLSDIMSGTDPRDSTCANRPAMATAKSVTQAPDFKKLRIGIPKEYFVDGVSKEVQKAVGEAIDWYKKQGAELVEVSLPNTQYAVAVYYIVAVSEASSNLSRFDGIKFGVRPESAKDAPDPATFYKRVRGQFGPEVKRRIILGTFALSSGYYDAYYIQACKVRRLIKNDFDRAFEKVDLIAAPVSPSTAFKLGEQVSDPLTMYLNDIFTIPVNLAGLPALSVPCGKDSSNLSIGLHLIGKPFAEDALLSAAHAFENAHPGLGRN